MSADKTIEGIAAISIILIFITNIIPALTQATGITIPLLGISLTLIIIGIILAMIKSWID